MAETISIQLAIGAKSYPLEVERSKEKIYRDAGKLINSKLLSYTSMFPNQQTDDYMAMAMIDIASKLVGEHDIDEQVEGMIHTIDQVLKLNPKD